MLPERNPSEPASLSCSLGNAPDSLTTPDTEDCFLNNSDFPRKLEPHKKGLYEDQGFYLSKGPKASSKGGIPNPKP